MAWVTIRRATENDVQALNQRAQEFARRHGIEVGGPCALDSASEVESALALERNAHLRPLWRRIVRRALGPGAEGIAHGYVGFQSR